MNSAEGLQQYLVLVLVGVGLALGTGCDENFLEPEPKSFLSSENTFTSKQGLRGLLGTSNELLRREYYGGNQWLNTEYMFTDVALNGQNEADRPHDMVRQITPTNDGVANVQTYWNHGFDGVNYANLIISNVDNVTDWSSEEEKNAMLASGYFHRAYWYYRLVHQFGDIPVYLNVIDQPRVDFETYKREAILKKIRDDLEFAVPLLPREVQPGGVNRAAGYYLLTKVYLSLRQFQEAVDAASQVIDGGGYALMTERFGNGPYADNPRFNVLWDLHQKENKSLAANTEVILVVQDDFGVEGSTSGGTSIMRNALPLWWYPPVRDPNGVHAVTAEPEGNPLADSLGRAIARVRTTPYFNYALWKDPTDLRHSEVNWFSLDDFYYNNPDSEYYGEPFVREFIGDTTQTWFPFQYNKLYVSDQIRASRKQGGHSDWYVFRLAGLYLLRAEAHYWMGQRGQAAADINRVRERAEAQPVRAGEVDISYIFDERARELYREEPRKTEMTRVAYIMAQLGRNGYSLQSMAQDNWYYDQVILKNVYFREQLTFGANPYIIEPYHVYWPVPQDEIDSNVQGFINQNEGYPGAEDNEAPLDYEALQALAEEEEGGGRAQ